MQCRHLDLLLPLSTTERTSQNDVLLLTAAWCPAVPNVNGRLPLSRPFHVRVMLPCYRESLELIQVHCEFGTSDL